MIAAAKRPTSNAPSEALTVVTAPSTEAPVAARMNVQPSFLIGAVSHGEAAAWVAAAVATKKAGKVLRVSFRSRNANSGHRSLMSQVSTNEITTANRAASTMSRNTFNRPLAKIPTPINNPTPYTTPTAYAAWPSQSSQPGSPPTNSRVVSSKLEPWPATRIRKNRRAAVKAAEIRSVFHRTRGASDGAENT